MRRARRTAVVVLALSPLLAACGPRVVFWGDSELYYSSAEVVSAQVGPEQSTDTVVYAKFGCGLMPSGDTNDCRAGSTQAEVDRYWKLVIGNDAASGKPGFIEVELGLNDAFWHTTAEVATYATRIRHFLKWLPAGVPVLWDNIPAIAPDVDAKSQVINQALRRVARSTPVLHVVDVRTRFMGHWPGWFQPDHVHFDQKGQNEFAIVNCRALNTVSAALDPRGVGVGAACDPTNRATKARRVS